MASLGVEPEELKVLEQLRQRLSLLVNNYQSLRVDINNSGTLPSAPSLQASHQILLGNIRSFANVVTENSDLFQRVVVRPSSNFPGRTQEPIITQLLRKKPEPQVEERAQRGREVGAAVERQPGAGVGGIDEKRELWDEASEWANARIARYVRDEAWSLFTVEEKAGGIEKVQTGLKRDIVAEEREREKAQNEDEDGDEEDEEEDEEEDLDDDDDDVTMVGAGVGGGGGQASRRAAKPLEEMFIAVVQATKKMRAPGRIKYHGAPGGPNQQGPGGPAGARPGIGVGFGRGRP